MSPVKEKQYATILERTAVPGECGAVRRNIQSPGRLSDKPDEDSDTLYKFFQRGKRISNNGPCLGTRKINADGSPGPYEWMSYGEVEEAAQRLGSGLMSLGAIVPCTNVAEDLNTTSGNHMMGLFSANRKEWVIGAEACNMYSFVSVPLYDTLGEDAIEFIVCQTEMTVLLCSGDLLGKVLDANATSLKLIVCMDSSIKPEDREKALSQGRQLYTFADIIAKGSDAPVEPIVPTSAHLATICYTSGTTGNPKGVMVTHRNFVADCAGVMLQGVTATPADAHLSYLPLAHMFERIVEALLFYSGSSVGFFRGNVKELMDDIAALRPTIFPSVPRLLNRVYDKVTAGVKSAGGLKAMLFNYALRSKLHYLKENNISKHWLWDKLVFNKVKARLGGRVRLLVTGSAPISPEVLDFLRVCLGCPCIEGYGQTETSAAATLSFCDDMGTSGHVGGPMTCVEIKLVDVPDMGYTSDSTSQQGEVCFRGPCVTPGYFKEAEKTQEAIDKDGWLHSGDIGQWFPNGTLKIIDRKKNIFKLSQGEYVAAEKIENVYARSPLVAQSFVCGDSLQSVLVAVIVPDFEVLRERLAKEGLPDLSSTSSAQDLASSEVVKKWIMEDLRKTGEEAKLRGFEKVKDIFVEGEEFSVDNGLLTPSFKLKRPQAREKYGTQIDAMYEKLNTVPTTQ